MLERLAARLPQRRRTLPFPSEKATLPEGTRGRPIVDPSRPEALRVAAAACPTGALTATPAQLDLGRCTFCGLCAQASQDQGVRLTPDYRLAASARADLVLSGDGARLAQALDARSRALFGRSLKLRQVSAGGCSGCEAELAALSNVIFDLARFGVQFVASPRHADGLVITGPVTANMLGALRDTYAAVPEPRLVIAVGACAISGGVFAGSDAVTGGVPEDIPVDLYVPGCPPHPLTILDGLLRLLGRIPAPGDTPSAASCAGDAPSAASSAG